MATVGIGAEAVVVVGSRVVVGAEVVAATVVVGAVVVAAGDAVRQPTTATAAVTSAAAAFGRLNNLNLPNLNLPVAACHPTSPLLPVAESALPAPA